MAKLTTAYRKWWERYMRRIRERPATEQVGPTPSDARRYELLMMTPAAWRRTNEWQLIRKRVLIWNLIDIVQDPKRLTSQDCHHLTYVRDRGLELYGDFEVCRGALHMHRHGRAA